MTSQWINEIAITSFQHKECGCLAIAPIVRLTHHYSELTNCQARCQASWLSSVLTVLTSVALLAHVVQLHIAQSIKCNEHSCDYSIDSLASCSSSSSMHGWCAVVHFSNLQYAIDCSMHLRQWLPCTNIWAERCSALKVLHCKCFIVVVVVNTNITRSLISRRLSESLIRSQWWGKSDDSLLQSSW